MPIFDLQPKIGINLDRWFLVQSGVQPRKIASNCHAFEKLLIECSHGIGQIRAKRECKLEYEDFLECVVRQKTDRRMRVIYDQRAKMMKEGKYTPPPCHTGGQ